jgi:hypothetical protein
LSKDALKFQSTIVLCYNQQFGPLQSHMPSLGTWAIYELVAPIVTNYILNQSYGHWLLGNVLKFDVFTCCDLCNDFTTQLFLIVWLTQMQIYLTKSWWNYKVLQFFIFVMHQFDKKKEHI